VPDGDDLAIPQLGDALPLVASDPRWLAVALADVEAVHADHLHCERKAASSALSLIKSYPEQTDLVLAMARLAHDETRKPVIAGTTSSSSSAMVARPETRTGRQAPPPPSRST
jgi:hypothetical protein